MRARLIVAAVAIALPTVALLPFAAFGDPPAAGKKGGGGAAAAAGESDKYDPENVRAISEVADTIAKANRAFEAKNTTQAIDGYKKAVQLDPKNPMGPYLLGEAYLASGNFGEAEAALKQAADMPESNRQSILIHSRALFALADCYEHEKKWTEAKTAWQAYSENSAKIAAADAAAYPASAEARIKAIDDIVKLQASYSSVRDKIAADKSDAGKDAAAKKK